MSNRREFILTVTLGTGALMAAGLAAMGMVARRRRRA